MPPSRPGRPTDPCGQTRGSASSSVRRPCYPCPASRTGGEPCVPIVWWPRTPPFQGGSTGSNPVGGTAPPHTRHHRTIGASAPLTTAHAPVEESGRPHRPVKAEIAGSKPVRRARVARPEPAPPGQVAQLVEHAAENRGVGSSILPLATARPSGPLLSTLAAVLTPAIDRELIKELKDAEDERFHAARPRSAALWTRAWESMPNGVPMAWHRGSYHHLPMWVDAGAGARFTDVDGFTYSDFNIADMSMFCGYAPEPVVRAVSDRMARGNQFLLPTEDAIVVSEELARRYRLPKWQYTLSASQANTEVIRVARVMTGRDKVLMFDGKYHGHFDHALVEVDDAGELVPEEHGLPADVTEHVVIAPFNDLPALETALVRGDVAVVMTEPAMTNNYGLVLPDDGFHAG